MIAGTSTANGTSVVAQKRDRERLRLAEKYGRLNVALIGCGPAADHHARFISASPLANLVAVADLDIDRARSLARRWAVGISRKRIEDVFEATPVDVVHVVTPPSTHVEIARTSLHRGAHVLVEKPLGLTAEEATGLYDLAEETNRLVCPDFIQLFHPRYLEALRLIRDGSFGSVRHVEVHFSVAVGDVRDALGSTPPHWSFLLPGGILHNYVTHPLYLALASLGDYSNISVASRSTGALPRGLTDHLTIGITGPSSTSSIVLSFATGSHYFVHLYCEHGDVLVNFRTLTVTPSTRGEGFVDRAVADAERGVRLFGGAVRSALDAVRGNVWHYHGLATLTNDFYRGAQFGAVNPISRDLAVAVARAEQEVVSHIERPHSFARNLENRQGRILRSSTVLVTGATGFIGRRVTTKLADEGFRVRCLVRPLSSTEFIEALGAEIVVGDLRDRDAVVHAVDGVNSIVHLGAQLAGSSDVVRDVCEQGTANIAWAARQEGVQHVIYSSSLAVYDYTELSEDDWITENTPLESHPEERGPMIAAKRNAEEVALAELAAGAVQWTVLRSSRVIDEASDPIAPVGVRLGRRLVCFGGPTKHVRLLHVDDLATVISRLVDRGGPGGVFVVSDPDVMTAKHYIQNYVRRIFPDLRPLYVPYRPASAARLGISVASKYVAHVPKVSKRHFAYLVSGAAADGERIYRSVGWRPEGSLLARLERAQGRLGVLPTHVVDNS
jgi:2-alkyl-3-oxoalkanoate reductase